MNSLKNLILNNLPHYNINSQRITSLKLYSPWHRKRKITSKIGRKKIHSNLNNLLKKLKSQYFNKISSGNLKEPLSTIPSLKKYSKNNKYQIIPNTPLFKISTDFYKKHLEFR